MQKVFGDRVREERLARGWSWGVLAQKASTASEKVRAGTIEKIETNHVRKSKFSRHIARAMDLDHDWLETGKGSKNLKRSADRMIEMLPLDVQEEVLDDVQSLVENRLSRHKVENGLGGSNAKPRRPGQ